MAAAAVTRTVAGRSASGPTPNPMVIPITITCSTTAYATATGGLPFDLFALLAEVAPFYAGGSANAYKDILYFQGSSTLGYQANEFAVGTVTADTIPCTVRLWNGLTEHADANTSLVLKGLLFVARNGAN